MSQIPYSESFYEQKYFPSLDGLRTLSIVPVVWHHSTPYTYAGVLGRGAIGVDLFFAISGFLITTLLIRERFERSRIFLRAFFIRRSFRIFPLYYLVLTLNVIYALWWRPDFESSQRFVANLPYYLTYTANWFHAPGLAGPSLFVFAWSLCTEEQFYVFWAPLLRYANRLLCAGCVMVVLISCDLLFEGLPESRLLWVPNGLRVILTSFACPIGFGAILALASHHPRFGRCVLTVASLPWAAPFVLVLASSLIIWPWAPVVVLHALLAFLVLVCSARKRHALSGLLEHPVLAYVGRVSYGIYLWHVAVIGGLKALVPHLTQEPFKLFVLAMPLSLGVAALSYEFFEKPWLRFGQRWKRAPSFEPSTNAVLDG